MPQALAHPPATTTPPLPAPIRRYVNQFLWSMRWLRLAWASLWAAAAFLAWSLGWCLADRFLGLPSALRTGVLISGIVATLAAIVRPLASLVRTRDWIGAAGELERRDPALQQRLITVVSQWLAPEGLRGSQAMLDDITRQLSGELAARRSRRFVPWRRVLGPAMALIAVLGLWAALGTIEWLSVPQLIQRYLRPLADLPPVSTTLIELSPAGVIEISEREALTIRATVKHLAAGPLPALHIERDGSWSRTTLTLVGEDAYALTLPAVEKDLEFYVEAGDARTRVTRVQVRRRPQVAEFRIRYVYPAYTGRAPLTLHNTDGLIEAPQGTQATISVVATEPLASAAMKVAGVRLEMTPGPQPNIRQASLAISRDLPWELEMVSQRRVPGKSAAPMLIRAVADRPPIVRLLQPASDLRLGPRDKLGIVWQALDDYGVAEAFLAVRVSSRAARIEYPLKLNSDARRSEGVYELDLAELDLKVGDVVTLTAHGTDRAGQKSPDDSRVILISPRSIDLATHRRVSELALAARYARSWAGGLEQARQYFDQAQKEQQNLPRDADRSGAASRILRELAAAGESANLLRQSLLRAIASGAGPKLADTLAWLLDGLMIQLDGAALTERALAAGDLAAPAARDRLGRAASEARDLAGRVRTLAEGEQCAVLLADRANLKTFAAQAATQPALRDLRLEIHRRAQQEISGALAGLGIDHGSRSVDAQLQQRIDAARGLMTSAPPVHLGGPASEWAQAVLRNDAQAPPPPRLEDRFYVAAQAQAVRNDPDLVGARDLHLAARAVVALLQRFAGPRDPETPLSRSIEQERVKALSQFAPAIEALVAEHAVNRRALRAVTPAEARTIHEQHRVVHARASAARTRLLSWAAGPSAPADEIAARVRELEDLAMNANAADALRDFDRAVEFDKRLAALLGRPDLAQASAVPRAVETLAARQETLAARATQPATSPAANSTELADAQRQLADQISLAGPASAENSPSAADTDSRQAATAALSVAQEKLASLPMQMTDAQQVAAAVADTGLRLTGAQAQLRAAAPDQKEAARRAVRQATDDADEARRALDAAIVPFSRKSLDETADSVRAFAPETSGAVGLLEDQLGPALDTLRDRLEAASNSGDRAGVEPAAHEVRQAIQQVQESLRQAQNQISERDPLVAARWFARAAADALAATPDAAGKRPPASPASIAAARQQRALEALQLAAADALRRSRDARLSEIPTFAQVYARPTGRLDLVDDRLGSGDRLLNNIPALRQWGLLRQRSTGTEPLAAPIRESEPAGYAESLRLYFDVLGRQESRPPPSGK